MSESGESWVGAASEEELRDAYVEWQHEKADLGEHADLSFEEWKQMERDIAEEGR